ncbi:UNVERIFIED_ORG: two-component system chemotaxis response regulator CheB [Idiomarina abyssalis]|uniref:Protein-glutamate methylesterase/protein-glutamine glutaminase n=1 Tax=Idiomarina loihiensis (strain ATCC BAA-735 / DSM 15497 / L2-TR) TaxID=283942 RepID=CHEB_IDILO|nr:MULTISPECIES: chemotaxis response regulator protein-glutamate methylesterase [Idiomarina]Q5QZQ3.1 RecName: Full=Protein-glutamate methylesterase/protein-glutamine glutaminase [Idiomarina loihiensis L2TR]AAV81953.1 Chemotaxis response regulator [Idiomarina loihiensis L2TR]AGM35983.1 chemotaxis-specific protein-glutamate methyltransferase [Idiomarina loihiensis GSL 199]PHQ91808.1 MAG: chemotaxis response regulator protein-glutamate methylesterase [Idiomarina sp.]PWW41682.1 two-component syste
MTVKVLVVDDSAFFRRRVTEILEDNTNIKVIGSANNGEEAVEQSRTLKPDVITMDIEMPVMNGIDAVKAIMSSNPCPILMFSSLTHEGATATLNALEAGAADFLPKKFEDIARNRDEAVKTLQDRVIAIARQPVSRTSARASTPPPVAKQPERSSEPTTALDRIRQRNNELQSQRESDARTATSAGALTINRAYQLLAIGTSTGGPVALQKILTQLPGNFPYPIVMVQHMPAAFTKAFSQRLDGLCQVHVKEAEDGDVLKAGTAYLAPGGKQMMVEGRPGSARLRIKDDTSGRITYKPSVDLTFASLSKTYMGKVLGVILTGMGADGRDGSRMLKDQGATIWAQDQASCVVYGMPQAVAQAGISTRSISLEGMAKAIMKEVGYSGL